MKCPACGAGNPEDALLCGLCGVPLRKDSTVDSPATSAGTAPPLEKKRRFPTPQIFFAGVGLLLLYLIVGWFLNRPVRHGPGVQVMDEPIQTDLEEPVYFKFKKRYHIRRLAEFELNARVLAKKYYGSGPESDLAPYDLAMGWFKMSDEAILDEIDISQRGRFYFWSCRQFPIARSEIEQNSANMHLIAADDRIADRIAGVRVGQIIRLKGALVRLNDASGWKWVSSLTRKDTGAGSCEVVFVEEFEVTKAGN
ncbi:MAG: hypothetical protein ACYTGH_05415 [Planctomycetota bacterium]